MRGVNKLVLEINSTEDEYFEKAILFVRSEKADCSQRELSQGARRLLDEAATAKVKRKWLPFVVVLCSVLAMAVAAVLIITLC